MTIVVHIRGEDGICHSGISKRLTGISKNAASIVEPDFIRSASIYKQVNITVIVYIYIEDYIRIIEHLAGVCEDAAAIV